MSAPATHRGPRSEEGFTLIEVLVAAFILVLGALGVFMTLAAGIGNVQRAKSTQVAVDVAQLEMEKLRSVPYEELALAEPPPSSGEPANPGSRVSGAEFALNRDGTYEQELCVAETGLCEDDQGGVLPGPAKTCVDGDEVGDEFDIEGARGQVYCYVTLLEDEACSGAGEGDCTYKRVTVDVWLEKPPNGSFRPNYYELQSDFIDPEPGP